MSTPPNIQIYRVRHCRSHDVELEELELFSGSDEYSSDDLGSDGNRICYEGDISSDEMTYYRGDDRGFGGVHGSGAG